MANMTRSGALPLALGLLLMAGGALASASTPLEGLVEVGSGEMRWFGMEIYDARLLNDAGHYDGSSISGPTALEITYRRNISRERLVRTTKSEWDRIGGRLGIEGRGEVEEWLRELDAIWPSVGPGDRIIAVVEPLGPTHFYGNDGLLGTVGDPEFGPAFLAIWLHPDTRAADLRAQLLGASQ